MKYQLNEHPDHSVVPVAELAPGCSGVIEHMGIYDDSSVIHLSRREITVQLNKNGNAQIVHIGARGADILSFQHFGYEDGDEGKRPAVSSTLSECDDKFIGALSDAIGLPLDELKELREIERTYRQSRHAEPASR